MMKQTEQYVLRTDDVRINFDCGFAILQEDLLKPQYANKIKDFAVPILRCAVAAL